MGKHLIAVLGSSSFGEAKTCSKIVRIFSFGLLLIFDRVSEAMKHITAMDGTYFSLCLFANFR